MAPPSAAQALALLLAACAAPPAMPAIVLGTEFSGAPFGGFVDISKGLRAWVDPLNGSSPVAVDASGWPTADAMTVVFDARCFPGWNPPCDDPWSWQAPINGSFAFRFAGKASISCGSDPGEKGVTVTNVTFDAASWTTSGLINLPAGAPNLVELSFTATQRSAASPPNSGFTNLSISQPGFAAGDASVDPRLLAALGVGVGLGRPLFQHVRYMGATGTNTNPGYYGDAGHHALSFADRCLPSDALVPNSLRPGCWGMSWEDVVRVTQASGLGAWVNLPVSATASLPPAAGDYAFQMATLFKAGNAATGGAGVGDAPIYLEHSNEVWNCEPESKTEPDLCARRPPAHTYALHAPLAHTHRTPLPPSVGFGQYIYNKLAAIDECNRTVYPAGCIYNNDGSTDEEAWAQRRHIAKVHALGQAFAAVFGAGSLNAQVRPIYADWPLFPQRYNATLAWFNATFGAPSSFLYGMAATGYFGGNAKALGPAPTADAIYDSYRNDSDAQLGSRAELAAVARYWGLKLVAYEAGPGWSVGETTGVGAWILAQRGYQMRDVVKYDVEASWAPAGGEAYNCFSLSGDYSRYGMWGFAEWLQNLTTPRYCALLDLTQDPQVPLPPAFAGCKGW